MTFCKIFAAKLLNTPWLLHLDVFRPALNAVLAGRSRPDLVGKVQGQPRWLAFECKGRISPPDATTKANAKTQAQRLITVNGTPCALHVGAVTYFRSDSLYFYWRDPVPEEGRGFDVRVSGDAWLHYYAPVVEALQRSTPVDAGSDDSSLVALEGVDVGLGVHPAIANYLRDRQWENAQQAATEAAESFADEGYQPDGLRVVAGETWRERFAEPGIAEEA